MSNYPIIFKNVSKKYDATIVLDNIHLNFRKNETTALIGTSGSGKSTILQMINGLLEPTSGDILVYNKPIEYKNIHILRRKIGYAVQGAALFPHFKVGKNITLMAKYEKWSVEKIEERLKYLMHLVELPYEFIEKYPHELSGGQKQRISLCRAMMLDPEIMLLDEPFSALDAITKAEIYIEFEKIHDTTPRTNILVTHDLREAIRLADNIIILNDGKVEQSGKVKEVIDNPASSFVKKFTSAQLHSKH